MENLITSLRFKSEHKILWQSKLDIFTKGFITITETWTQTQSWTGKDGGREESSWST